MELKKYLLAGGLASVLVLGACGEDTATDEEDPAEQNGMEEEGMDEGGMDDEGMDEGGEEDGEGM